MTFFTIDNVWRDLNNAEWDEIKEIAFAQVEKNKEDGKRNEELELYVIEQETKDLPF